MTYAMNTAALTGKKKTTQKKQVAEMSILRIPGKMTQSSSSNTIDVQTVKKP